MTDVIDAYTHAATEPVIEELLALQPGVAERFANAPHFVDAERRIEDMDAAGVDRQVLAGLVPMTTAEMDPDDALGLTRLLNDELRRLADEHPDRFVPTATIPQFGDPFVEELDRCIDDLDVAGVQIWSNVRGRFLDDEAFYPIYEVAADAGCPVWIHPRSYPWHDYAPEDRWIYSALGWPFDTTVALARLVYNGVLAEFPDLRVVAHHLGGFLPYVEERIKSFHQTRTEDPELYVGRPTDLPASPETYFERVYADTAVSPRGKTNTLECGYEFFGPDNLLYATDYPWGPEEGRFWLRHSKPAIEAMDLSSEERAAVLGGNLADLIG